MNEFELPSGKKVVVEKLLGKHLRNAQRQAHDKHDLIYALIAEAITIDGAKLHYEELLDLDLADVAMLLERVGTFDFLSQAPKS